MTGLINESILVDGDTARISILGKSILGSVNCFLSRNLLILRPLLMSFAGLWCTMLMMTLQQLSGGLDWGLNVLLMARLASVGPKRNSGPKLSR